MELHRCDAPRQAGGALVRKRNRSLTVDVHAHALIPAVEALVKDRPEKLAEPEAQRRALGAVSQEYNAKTMRPTVFPKMTSVELRLRDMDEIGIDVQVVSPTPLQSYAWAEHDLARDIVRTLNEALAEECAKHPTRLAALGGVSLQHPELAIAQLEHCTRELGMRGVEISTSVRGLELDDPAFAGFWAKAEEIGCIVFIHPADISSLGARLSRFYLQNIVGRPMETTIALSHLIFGGVLDRHPGLKILAAHGGGYLPFYAGRSDHAHAVRPECRSCQHPPSDYLKRIYFDSLVYTPEGLRNLVSNVGASQVMLGTDYPYDVGFYGTEDLVQAAGLNETDQTAVLGANAVRLFGLEALAAKHRVTS